MKVTIPTRYFFTDTNKPWIKKYQPRIEGTFTCKVRNVYRVIEAVPLDVSLEYLSELCDKYDITLVYILEGQYMCEYEVDELPHYNGKLDIDNRYCDIMHYLGADKSYAPQPGEYNITELYVCEYLNEFTDTDVTNNIVGDTTCFEIEVDAGSLVIISEDSVVVSVEAFAN